MRFLDYVSHQIRNKHKKAYKHAILRLCIEKNSK